MPEMLVLKVSSRSRTVLGDPSLLASLRLAARVVPDPQRHVASHQRVDELAEVFSVVELNGDLVPRLLHRVVTCISSYTQCAQNPRLP